MLLSKNNKTHKHIKKNDSQNLEPKAKFSKKKKRKTGRKKYVIVQMDLPIRYCVANKVMVGLPSICFQLMPRKATFAVKVLASNAGSRVM